MLFLHKLWPVVLDNIIADITIKIIHCIASKTYFILLWERVNFTQRLSQLTNQPPCCVLALNMIKISSLIRLTTDSLTHWGRDKVDVIFQATFWNGYSWLKMFKFRLKFHWSLFLRFQLTIFQHWFRSADQATRHYLNQKWIIYWRIYASLVLNELRFFLDPARSFPGTKAHRTFLAGLYSAC